MLENVPGDAVTKKLPCHGLFMGIYAVNIKWNKRTEELHNWGFLTRPRRV